MGEQSIRERNGSTSNAQQEQSNKNQNAQPSKNDGASSGKSGRDGQQH